MSKKISIIGIQGVPAAYGGFETLVENLVLHHEKWKLSQELIIYCCSKNYPMKAPCFHGAKLRYIPFSANGISSILYDILSIFSAVRINSNVILILGVSGAIVLPLIRLLSSAMIITNIDGIEWRRGKWKGLAKKFLKISEWFAIKFSHKIIADNQGIAQYIYENYGKNCSVIAYGGDHAFQVNSKSCMNLQLPKSYALGLCRIEPENNIAMILDAFSYGVDISLVFIGNWNNSDYGRQLRLSYSSRTNLILLDPIYDLGILRAIRSDAYMYVHGHSAGGSNPSLIEAMYFSIPILTFDCIYNRYTTEGKALYFKNSIELRAYAKQVLCDVHRGIGLEMLHIAKQRYSWDEIGSLYFEICG